MCESARGFSHEPKHFIRDQLMPLDIVVLSQAEGEKCEWVFLPCEYREEINHG